MKRFTLCLMTALMAVLGYAQTLVTPPADAAVEDWNISYTYNYFNEQNQNLSEPGNETMKVVFDGSDVYFYFPNPINGNAWVKGTLNGTMAVFAKNQVIGKLGTETAYFAGFSANGLCDVEFTYDADAKIFTLGEMYVLYNSSTEQAAPWAYLTQVVVSKEVIKDPDPVVAPDNLTTQEYVFKGTSIQFDQNGSVTGMVPEQWNVRVGFVGSKEVYIQGLCQYMRNAWVKGTIDDGVLKIEKGQYYGKMSGMKFFFGGVFMNALADAEFTVNDGNFESGSYYVALNSTAETLAPYSVWAGVSITKVADVAATPATPSVDQVVPYDATQGAGIVFFNLPDTDVNGNAIVRDNLSYRMWIQKGEEKSIYTFQKPTYYYVTTPMTDVPYFYSDGYDLYVGGSAVYLFEEMNTWDKVGVQTIYKGGNETHLSDIGWYDMKSGEKTVETGISEVAANRQAVEATFDLQGRRVGASARGLVIRQQRMADGTVRTVKVLK